MGNFVARQAEDAYNAAVDRVTSSDDPMYEVHTMLEELVIEVSASAAIGSGVSALVGRAGMGAVVAEDAAITATSTGGNWAKTSGILRDAVKGKGNYGLGSGTFDEAMQAGRAWVGDGFRISKDGSSWISSNGLRQFRPPSFKPRLGIEQANFQWTNINKGAWQSNGHLDIKP